MDTARHVGELRIVIACDISDETLDINHIKLPLCGTVSDTLCCETNITATTETMFLQLQVPICGTAFQLNCVTS